MTHRRPRRPERTVVNGMSARGPVAMDVALPALKKGMPFMFHPLRNGRWLVAPALLLTFCSGGPSPSSTGPSTATAPSGAGAQGATGSSAVGDVKIGSGPLEMVRLRMDRQGPLGTSVRQYANPGGSYRMEAGETIELWAEWNYNEVAGAPRFKVEWGDGSEPDIIGCGSCLLTHKFPATGVYTLRVSLDDRVGTRVTRSFDLDSRPPEPDPGPVVVLLQTVCALPAPEVFAGGNCSSNTTQFANWWCQLGGFAKAVSFTEVSSGNFMALKFEGGPTAVLSSCAQVGGSSYAFSPTCTGVRDLRCGD